MKVFAASAGGLRPKDTRGHFFLPEEGGFGAFSVSSARGFLCGRSALKFKRGNRNFLISDVFDFCFAFWDFAFHYPRHCSGARAARSNNPLPRVPIPVPPAASAPGSVIRPRCGNSPSTTPRGLRSRNVPARGAVPCTAAVSLMAHGGAGTPNEGNLGHASNTKGPLQRKIYTPKDGHDSRGRTYKAETQLPTFAKCVVHRMFSGVPSASRTQPRSEGRERR